MSDRQSPRFAAHALFPFSSSAILDTVYSGRELNGRPEKVAQRAHRAPVSDAIWGQFNNYRSNGLAGSAIVHIALLRLMLSAATFGHPVVKQVQQLSEGHPDRTFARLLRAARISALLN